MITASAGFVSAVQQDARHFYAQIIHDNSVVDCEVMNFTLKKGAFDNSDFLVGAVYSSSAEIHVTGLTDALENEDVSLQVGLEVNGAVEYITVGTFTVTKAQSTAYETILTCGGFISTKLNATLPTVATQTLANIAAAITSTTGVSITFSGFASTDITVTKSLLNVTCRGALELIAFLLGGYATEQADGSVVVQKFTTTGASLAVDGDVMQNAPVTAGDAFTMTGVKVIQSPAYESEDASGQPTVVPEVSWTSGSPLRQTYNSEYMTASAFTIFAADIVGYSFTPAVVSVALGDPRLEACDVLTVTDLDESVYIVPCHMIDATYDGGYMMTVTAFGESESESAPEGAVVKELNALATKLDSAEAATAIAKQAAAQAQSSADDAATAAANAQTSANNAASAAATANTNASAAIQAANTASANASAAQSSAAAAKAQAENAGEYAARALGNLSTVQSVAETLTYITQHGTMTLTSDVALDPTHVYFVVDAGGDYTVGGTTYAIVTEPDVDDIATYYELTIDESLQNYVGTHLSLTGEGLWLLPAASNTNKVLIATGAGTQYTIAGTYLIDASGNTVASFRADGATMSAQGVQIAHLGYGAGKDSGGGTSNAPFYTLGTRASGSTVGNYSVAEGWNTRASGYAAHAEGTSSIASGLKSHAENSSTASEAYAHAEGNGTEAGYIAHAEGLSTIASGVASHAEGNETEASGNISHAQNAYTIAASSSQTALGRYNIADYSDTFAVIIGNGRFDEITQQRIRSNALTVDWSGNVETAGDITDGSGNVLSAVASALSNLITTETYDLGAVSYTAGTIGTVGTTKTTTITKSGYTPIAASVEFVTTSAVSFISFMNTSKDTAYTQFVRRQSTAYSTTYHAYLYVTYVKN